MSTFTEHVPRHRDGTYVCCGGYGEHFDGCYVGMLVAENRELRDALEQVVMAAPASILTTVVRTRPEVLGHNLVAPRTDDCGICNARSRAGRDAGPPHGPCTVHNTSHCTAEVCW